jgi:hypothetical protein
MSEMDKQFGPIIHKESATEVTLVQKAFANAIVDYLKTEFTDVQMQRILNHAGALSDMLRDIQKTAEKATLRSITRQMVYDATKKGMKSGGWSAKLEGIAAELGVRDRKAFVQQYLYIGSRLRDAVEKAKKGAPID